MNEYETTRVILLDASTDAGEASAVADRSAYSEHAVQVTAANAASKVKVQVSVDGTTFVDLTELTGSVYYAFSGCYPYVKVTRSDATTDALTVQLAGQHRYQD